jgi:hypothetical protein
VGPPPQDGPVFHHFPFYLPSFSNGCTLHPHVAVYPEAWTPSQVVDLSGPAVGPAFLDSSICPHLCFGVLGAPWENSPGLLWSANLGS